jgi:hypothetical protein
MKKEDICRLSGATPGTLRKIARLQSCHHRWRRPFTSYRGYRLVGMDRLAGVRTFACQAIMIFGATVAMTAS